MFGWSGWRKNSMNKTECVACDEKTPFKPMSPYAVAKLYGYWIIYIEKPTIYSLLMEYFLTMNHPFMA